MAIVEHSCFTYNIIEEITNQTESQQIERTHIAVMESLSPEVN